MQTRFLTAAIFLCAAMSAFAATTLTESSFTEIIREANVVTTADKSVAPARTNEVFKVPDLVRTGPASRVEMTAPDKTVTRIGANTVFTFEPGERNIRMQRGSILFHSPAGAGGGAIKYHGTAAAVLGTTMLCAVMPDGRFKILDLEGHVKVTLATGKSVTLNAGEMVIVYPDGNDCGEVMVFNLGKLVPHLLLVTGFSQTLSSMPLILAAVQAQDKQIAGGNLDLDHFAPPEVAAFGLDLIGGNAGLVIPPTVLATPDFTTAPISPVHP
jgi:hypothetical protein